MKTVYMVFLIHTKWFHIDGSMQKRCNSIANALELRLFCTKPSMSNSCHIPVIHPAARSLLYCHLNLDFRIINSLYTQSTSVFLCIMITCLYIDHNISWHMLGCWLRLHTGNGSRGKSYPTASADRSMLWHCNDVSFLIVTMFHIVTMFYLLSTNWL